MSASDLETALSGDADDAYAARQLIKAAAAAEPLNEVLQLRLRLAYAVRDATRSADAASDALEKSEAARALAEAGLRERVDQLRPYATAENDHNRALDALFIACMHDRGALARELRVVGDLCRATRSEEVLWSSLSRVQQGNCGRTALMFAARTGNLERVQWLLARGAPRDARTIMDDAWSGGTTALHFAVRAGHVNIVCALLLAGADVNILDSSDFSPLSFAALYGHHAVVHALLGAGAAPDNLYTSIHTPLSYACAAGNTDIVRSLLAAGANPSGLIGRGVEPALTPLSCAEKSNPEIVRLLLAAGANVNQRLVGSRTVLGKAIVRCLSAPR